MDHVTMSEKKNRSENWTDSETSQLLKLIKEKKQEHGKNYLNKNHWGKIAEELKRENRRKPPLKIEQLKWKFNHLQTEFKVYRKCVDKPGWSWDITREVPKAPTEKDWDEAIESDNNLAKCRRKPFPWYKQVAELCKADVPDGKLEAEELEEELQNNVVQTEPKLSMDRATTLEQKRRTEKYWSISETSQLLKLIKEKKEKHRSKYLSMNQWAEIAKEFNSKNRPNPPLQIGQLKGKVNYVRSEFKGYKKCVEKPGWRWDSTRNLPIAPTEKDWVEAIESDGSLAKCQTKPFPLYELAAQFFGADVPDGENGPSDSDSVEEENLMPAESSHASSSSFLGKRTRDYIETDELEEELQNNDVPDGGLEADELEEEIQKCLDDESEEELRNNDSGPNESPSGVVGVNDLLIVGPGVLGRIIAQMWQQEYPGCKIFGQTMSSDHHSELAELGILPLLRGSPISPKVPYVIFCAPQSRPEDYPGDLSIAASNWNCEGSFLFTSSSAMYIKNDNGWFSEDSPVVPRHRSPRTDILLKAEKVVLKAGGCVLRLARLYKEDRGAHVCGLQKGIDDDQIQNLIHYEDAASLSIAVMKKKLRSRIFLGCDNYPISRLELADCMNRSGKFSKKFEVSTGTDGPLGKMLNNAKTRKEIGWEPKYPSFPAFWGLKD